MDKMVKRLTKIKEYMDIVKFKDACHVASAIYAQCDCFISTDKRLLKYRSPRIELFSPIEFLLRLEGR